MPARLHARNFRPEIESLERRDVPTTATPTLDLTTVGSQGEINCALFTTTDVQPTGTGVIDSFLRIQGGKTGVEQGYNTDGKTQFDEKGGAFTHSLRLSDVPFVSIGNVAYREFLIDINETSSNPLVSLDELRFYVAGTGNLTGYNATTKQLGGYNAVYDMDAGAATDNWIMMNYSLNHGSGSGDVFVYIPARLFASDQADPYVYLYCKLGVHAGADAGFEEWAVAERTVTDLASLSGNVYGDDSRDGVFDANEVGIEGVLITLTGIDDQGHFVTRTTYTDTNGHYSFDDLRPGRYTLTETQPAGYDDGMDTLGTTGGTIGEDKFTEIFLGPGMHGTDYNFGEVLSPPIS